MTTLTGKSIIITGAASGMGAACAELARSRGAQVLAVDRDERRLAAAADGIGVPYHVCDLSHAERLDEAVDHCVRAFGRVDGLVNAAGVHQTREMPDITPHDFDRLFAVNVRGLFFMQQAAARAMSEGGGIVNVASTAARLPRPVTSHYAATKAAVVSITRSAAVALASRGIRVNSVCPGVIETPMIEAIRRQEADLLHTTPAEVNARWRAANPMGRLALHWTSPSSWCSCSPTPRATSPARASA
jgi:D-sorbitol dehydrogenase (acceptor)